MPRAQHAIALLCALTIAASLPAAEAPELDDKSKERILDAISATLARKAYVHGTAFERWPALLEERRPGIAASSTRQTFAKNVQLALDSFGITHLYLFDPEQVETRRTGKMDGRLGIFSTNTPEGDVVRQVPQTSPAYLAGIRRGDFILAIDGLPIAQRKPGSDHAAERTVRWRRGAETFEKTIVIRPFTLVDPPALRWLEDDIALIAVNAFDLRSYKPWTVGSLLKKAKRSNGIILDFRFHQGGLAPLSLHLSSHFADWNTPFHHRVGRREQIKIRRRHPDTEVSRETLLAEGTRGRPWPSFAKNYDGPVVILVGSDSASAGELFPAAMQELGLATVIGTKTRGAVISSWFKSLPSGFLLQYPVWEIAPPSGRKLEGVGLVPDIELSTIETATDSIILSRAIEIIREKNNSKVSP